MTYEPSVAAQFRQRLLTLAEWIWMYIFYERGVRLITGRSVPRPVRPSEDPKIVDADETGWSAR